MDSRRNGSTYTRMFYPFPNVQVSCLVCGGTGCARWKGYYCRQWVCHINGLSGLIAIHVSHCRTKNCDCCYFPSFLVPGRRTSRASVHKFIEGFAVTHSVKNSIDEFVGGFETSDFTMALSSAYDLIYAFVRSLRINHGSLCVLASEKTSVTVLYTLPKVVIPKLFNLLIGPWHGAQCINIYPP